MAHDPIHDRCQWCGICLTCQRPLALDSKCGQARLECKRAERFRRLNERTNPIDKTSQ